MFLSFIFSFTAPSPTTAMVHTANICVGKHQSQLYDPLTCDRLESLKEAYERPDVKPNQIVFAIRFPHRGFKMTPWFQFIAASIRLDIDYNPDNPYGKAGMVNSISNNLFLNTQCFRMSTS